MKQGPDERNSMTVHAVGNALFFRAKRIATAHYVGNRSVIRNLANGTRAAWIGTNPYCEHLRIFDSKLYALDNSSERP